jgi:hypothetical protein
MNRLVLAIYTAYWQSLSGWMVPLNNQPSSWSCSLNPSEVLVFCNDPRQNVAKGKRFLLNELKSQNQRSLRPDIP